MRLPGSRSRIAVAVACLASCAAAGGVAASPSRRPHHPRWRVSTLPVPAHGSFSFAEPGIEFGPRGLAIADAASANTGAPPTFWLSRNGGRSWSVGRDLDPSGAATGDADALIGPDGYLYALNLGADGTPNPTVLVYRSRDGRTWSGPASFPPPHGTDQPDRPWLVVDPRDPADVDVVNSEGAGDFVIWHSPDHAAHFAGPYAVGGDASGEAALALSSRPLFDPTVAGRMFMLYETVAPGTLALPPVGGPLYEFPITQLWLASSPDGGLHWSDRLVLDSAKLTGPLHGATLAHLLVASAIDRAGRLYAAFSARDAGATRTSVYLIHSSDHGASWSAPVQVPVPTASNVMPALAVGSSRVAYLSWYGSNAADFRSSSARWVELFARIANPLAASPRFAVRRLSGAAPVHVGGIDTAGNVGSELGANWGLRDFQSIALDACGRPHVVWAVDVGRPATEIAGPGTRCAPRRRRCHRVHGRRRCVRRTARRR